MAEKNSLTAARLREVLHYDPLTGVFTWLVRLSQNTRVGQVAGRLTCYGYLDIGIDGRRYLAHRLAWLYVHGRWPIGKLDHRFEVKTDNRIDQLREATHALNMHNIVAPRANNSSGFRGVWRCRGKWQSGITINHTKRHLGTFDTPELAHQAYVAAKLQTGYFQLRA